jgi:hypothetical protein
MIEHFQGSVGSLANVRESLQVGLQADDRPSLTAVLWTCAENSEPFSVPFSAWVLRKNNKKQKFDFVSIIGKLRI